MERDFLRILTSPLYDTSLALLVYPFLSNNSPNLRNCNCIDSETKCSRTVELMVVCGGGTLSESLNFD